MKKKFLLLAALLFVIHFTMAQSLAVNTDGSTADASALLDVNSTLKGVLIPRMTKAERNAIATPATGLLVFQNAPDSAGFYYFDGGKWNWMAAINGNADTLSWKRNGNALTDPATHFIGTTDNRVLNFKVNNTRSGIIDNVSYNAAFGFSSQLNNLSGTHNTSMGYGALISNSTGNYNTSVGAFSSYNNVAGIRNTAIGTSALYFNNANDNTAVGYEALNQTSSVGARQNTAVGSNAMRQNSSGIANTAVGDSAGYLLTASSYNVFFGKNAGRDNLGSWTTLIGIDAGPKNTANGSVFIGSAAGMKNTSGFGNTFVGDNSGREVITGSNNTFFGSYAGQATTGSGNSFFGRLAGYNNTSGYSNIAYGHDALRTNTTGSNLIAIGDSALFNNSGGTRNTAVGSKALYTNTSGTYNTATGFQSLNQNGTGNNNTALGSHALILNTNGSANTSVGSFSLSNLFGFNNYNVAIGDSAARNLASGSNNVVVGTWAFKDHTTGSINTAIGNFAMGERESGNFNTAVGGGSLWNTNSDLNTGIGYLAGTQNVSGTNNTYLGANVIAGFDNLINSTAIGANSFVNVSNKVRIGSSAVTVIEGQVAYSFPSDGRFKTAVTESVKGLDFITRLRPVIYNFQTEKYDTYIRGEENNNLKPVSSIDFAESEKIRHSGFIAQEVVKAARAVGYDFDGVVIPKNSKETYSLAYSQFVVPLVKAVQEQQVQIEELKKELQELKALIRK